MLKRLDFDVLHTGSGFRIVLHKSNDDAMPFKLSRDATHDTSNVKRVERVQFLVNLETLATAGWEGKHNRLNVLQIL